MKATVKKTVRPKSRIPMFASREKAAKWFDTHDMADYQDEFKTVRAQFAKPLVPRTGAEGNLSEGITIRLDPQTMAEVRSRARQKGIGPTTLIRMWIIERLTSSDR